MQIFLFFLLPISFQINVCIDPDLQWETDLLIKAKHKLEIQVNSS
jgi:hypothetical protein